jgi:anti-sigma factor RsiW
MTCEVPRERINALFDGELPPGEALEVERHLKSCPACDEAYVRLRRLRDALQTPGLAFTPPPELEERVRADLRGARPRPVNVGLRPFLALAASLILGVAIGRFLLPAGRGGLPHSSAEALVDAHVRALASGRLIDVVSSDQHTVKPWFAGKVPFSPSVTDLTAEGFPLLGGRVDNVSGSPAAVLVYTRARHVIEVFVQVADGSSSPHAKSGIRGFHVVTWTQGDLVYQAVSDLNEGELATFAASVIAR